MKRKVYLMGIDHRLQRVGTFGVRAETSAELGSTIKELLGKLLIEAIVEELGIEGLGMHEADSGSVGLLIARELRLPHLYCDPPAEIRLRLQIETPAERQRYWLGQLKGFRWFPCLFILEPAAVTSFADLLARSEFDFAPTILFPEWVPSMPLENT